MSWFCPTFQRPERLAELAMSWEMHEQGRKLYVRVWEGDPRRDDYLNITWPEGWELYVSPAEWCGEALEEFYQKYPDEEFYGFIADDIVLRTPKGLEKLERLAEDWSLAYPNDTIQRHHLATHFCIGGELVREVGFLVPYGMKHNYLDVVWMHLGMNLGALRYCPDVIFQHKHFLRGVAEMDDTYKRIYSDPQTQVAELEAEGKAALEQFMEKDLRGILERVLRKQRKLFENPEKWEARDEFICRNIA